MFLGRDQAMMDLKDKALKLLKEENPGQCGPTFSPIPIFEDLYTESMGQDEDDVPLEKKSLDDVAIYLHSSGGRIMEIYSNRSLFAFSRCRINQFPQANSVDTLSLTPVFIVSLLWRA